MSIMYPVVMFLYEEPECAPLYGQFGVYSQELSLPAYLKKYGIEVGDCESDNPILRARAADVDLLEWMIFGLTKGFGRSYVHCEVRERDQLPIEQFYRGRYFRFSVRVAYTDSQVMEQLSLWNVPLVETKPGKRVSSRADADAFVDYTMWDFVKESLNIKT